MSDRKSYMQTGLIQCPAIFMLNIPTPKRSVWTIPDVCTLHCVNVNIAKFTPHRYPPRHRTDPPCRAGQAHHRHDDRAEPYHGHHPA